MMSEDKILKGQWDTWDHMTIQSYTLTQNTSVFKDKEEKKWTLNLREKNAGLKLLILVLTWTRLVTSDRCLWLWSLWYVSDCCVCSSDDKSALLPLFVWLCFSSNNKRPKQDEDQLLWSEEEEEGRESDPLPSPKGQPCGWVCSNALAI